MDKTAIFPEGAEQAAEALKLSPAVIANGLMFLTGVTGSGPDGAMPAEPRAQFEAVFHKIGAVLDAAGAGYDNIVEMTSYHIDIASHFETFETVRAGYVRTPYPAWTAVEVAGLRRLGALVEVRVVAQIADGPARRSTRSGL